MIVGEIDASGLKNLIGFQKNEFNSFQSTSERYDIEYPEQWTKNNAALKELVYATYSEQGMKTDSSATKILNIDGLDFQSYEFTVYTPDGKVFLSQIMYSRLINEYDFGVNINYNNEADKKEMLEALLNSKFKK